MWRRRAAWLLFVAMGCTRGRRAPEGPPDVSIVYAADLRGAVAAPANAAGGLARRATLVDRARLWARAVVQVDAGDVAPSAEDEPALADGAAREARARLALRAYRRMGVDAVAVGERDIALGAARWRALCDEAKVPVLAANIVGVEGQLLFPATRIVRAGDVTVGVFAVLEVSPQGWTALPGVALTDATAASRAAVQSLRAQGAGLIVGLFHVAGGLERAKQIAAAAAGIDSGRPGPRRRFGAAPGRPIGFEGRGRRPRRRPCARGRGASAGGPPVPLDAGCPRTARRSDAGAGCHRPHCGDL